MYKIPELETLHMKSCGMVGGRCPMKFEKAGATCRSDPEAVLKFDTIIQGQKMHVFSMLAV